MYRMTKLWDLDTTKIKDYEIETPKTITEIIGMLMMCNFWGPVTSKQEDLTLWRTLFRARLNKLDTSHLHTIEREFINIPNKFRFATQPYANLFFNKLFNDQRLIQLLTVNTLQMIIDYNNTEQLEPSSFIRQLKNKIHSVTDPKDDPEKTQLFLEADSEKLINNNPALARSALKILQVVLSYHAYPTTFLLDLQNEKFNEGLRAIDCKVLYLYLSYIKEKDIRLNNQALQQTLEKLHLDFTVKSIAQLNDKQKDDNLISTLINITSSITSSIILGQALYFYQSNLIKYIAQFAFIVLQNIKNYDVLHKVKINSNLEKTLIAIHSALTITLILSQNYLYALINAISYAINFCTSLNDNFNFSQELIKSNYYTLNYELHRSLENKDFISPSGPHNIQTILNALKKMLTMQNKQPKTIIDKILNKVLNRTTIAPIVIFNAQHHIAGLTFTELQQKYQEEYNQQKAIPGSIPAMVNELVEASNSMPHENRIFLHTN